MRMLSMSLPREPTTPTADQTYTRTHRNTKERTRSPTNNATAATTLAPTLPPAVQTYFGYGPYRARYPDYTPTAITGAVSGLPLLFAPAYRALSAMRFTISDAYNPVLRLGLNASSGVPYSAWLSLTKTASAATFDGVYVGNALCSQFIDPSTH